MVFGYNRSEVIAVALSTFLTTRGATAEKSDNGELGGPPAASVQAGEKGFDLRSAGEEPGFLLRVGALIQADSRMYFDDRTKDNVLLRRVRPILAGTVLGLLEFNLTPDFGGGQASLVDAYLNARAFPWLRVRVGKFKAPIGLERLQGDADLPLPERALTSNLVSSRDVGLQLWGEVAEGIVTYAAAVLDGAPDNASIDQDVGGSKDVAGRLFVQPFKRATALGALGFGVAGTTGQRNGSPRATSLVGFRTTGQTALFSYAAPTSDPTGGNTVFASGRHSRFNPEIDYYRGGWGLLGEVVWSQQEVHKSGEVAVLTHRAWHATLSYVIGGTNGYKGATPDHPWDPAATHLGAVEIAVRYGVVRFDDAAFPLFADRATSARSARNVGVSANWVLSRLARVALNYERTRFVGGAGKEGSIEDRSPENFFLTRAQLNF